MGVAKDLMTAYSWCSLAAEQQHEEAKEELTALLRELEAMTAALEAQRLRLVEQKRREEEEAEEPVQLSRPVAVATKGSVLQRLTEPKRVEARTCINPRCRHYVPAVPAARKATKSGRVVTAAAAAAGGKTHYCSDRCRVTHTGTMSRS
jgi:TPR repeat protein